MVYPIVKYGNPVLEREAEDVTEFGSPQLDQFLADMFESMYAAKGVGLAAPQISWSSLIPKSSRWKASRKVRKDA
jgi:peptide deformylase